MKKAKEIKIYKTLIWIMGIWNIALAITLAILFGMIFMSYGIAYSQSSTDHMISRMFPLFCALFCGGLAYLLTIYIPLRYLRQNFKIFKVYMGIYTVLSIFNFPLGPIFSILVGMTPFLAKTNAVVEQVDRHQQI